MALDHYVRKGSKKLRYGYTTGTCAALAAEAAVRVLLTGEKQGSVSMMTAKGILVEVIPADQGFDQGSAWAGVIKDAGDDADITDGMMICARVSRREREDRSSENDRCQRVNIDGGEGVGRVKKQGLDQPVGNAAINSGPRKMIAEQVEKACEELGYEGGVDVTIFVPEGEEAAKRTFNSHLGIEGGISILGTTGIVEPMSQQALVETIELEMKQDGLISDCLVLTPGNYGMHYIEDQGLDGLRDEKGTKIPVLKFSNFLGETLDMLPCYGIRKVLLVGHAGKLVKVAGGIMNTHSSWADCRREILCAHCAVCGGSRELCEEIMDGATTDACFDLIDEEGLLEEVIRRVIRSIQSQLERRVEETVEIGTVMFSNERGTLGISQEGKAMLDSWS